MKTLLITPTLLNSFDFAANGPPSWRKKALEEFTAKIHREPFEMSEPACRGIQFENVVYRAVRQAGSNTVTEGSKHFQQIAAKCKGGDFQKVVKSRLDYDEEFELLLYNKLDVYFPSRIVDIKTTAKYKSPNKFLNTWQHWLYCFSANVPEFEYVVAVWDEYPKIKEVHEIPWTMPSVGAEDIIRKGISNCFYFIQELGLWDAYVKTFSKNG